MRFTNEDFLEIKNWLELNGVKDSQFPQASVPLRGDETIVIVQNGINVLMTLAEFITYLSILSFNVDVDFIKLTVIDTLTEDIEWVAEADADDDPTGPTAEVALAIEDI